MSLTSDLNPAGAAIGVSLVAIGAAVAAGAARTLLGLRLVNAHASLPIAATVVVRRGGNDYPLVAGPNIRLGGAIEGLSGSKFVLLPGDQLLAKSSVAASLYVFASYDESPNA